MQSVSEGSLRVYIGGDEYSIKSDTDSGMTKKVAEYVDRKVMELQKNITSRDKVKVAVLSALNIAGELFESKAKNDQLRQQIAIIKQQTEKIARKIDSTL
jgi:cell division protein ZapA